MKNSASPSSRVAHRILSAENLAEDFGAKADVARHGVRALYDGILAAADPDVTAAFGRWKAASDVTRGRDGKRSSRTIAKLATHYGVETDRLEPEALLFALQSYYALLVKLLVGHVVASTDGLPDLGRRLSATEDSERLRREMERFEAGGILGELGVVDFFRDNPFSWYTTQWSLPVDQTVRRLVAQLACYDGGTLWKHPHGGGDLLKQLYQELFPRPLRHELGEYYTPDWLADHVLEKVGYEGDPDRRLLDPACGSGTFLVKAVQRVRAWYARRRGQCRLSEEDLCRKILANVVGADLNPLAVMTAKANYVLAMGDLLPHAGGMEIPVHLCDSILGGSELSTSGEERFDYMVGNPPWIAWDHLPEDYRRATKPLWQQYGLFSLSGNEGRHGGGKKDLSMLMMHCCADRHLRRGGRLGLVITQTLFQTKGAGDGFRRFRLGPKGDWLGVLRVDDMVALRPFRDAANWTSTIVAEKGTPTRYPVPYVKWSRDAQRSGKDGNGVVRHAFGARPIDPQRPGSPWFLWPEGMTTEASRLIGPSDYRAHLGANSGGANGVYWVAVLSKVDGGVLVRNMAEKGKLGIRTVEKVIEPDLLYPLLRWGDVARFHAVPSAHVLLTQDVHTRTGIDETVMRSEYPKTYDYVKGFDGVLKKRAAYKRYQDSKPFYSMYNVGPYTTAPIKVVWRRMDRRINAAVVEPVDDPLLGPRPVIPQETCVLIRLDSVTEAHYVCAVLNSSVVDFLVTSYSVCGGKGFGTPGMLDFLRLERFRPRDPQHEALADWGRQAHDAAAAGEEVAAMQVEIDRLVGKLWGLGEGEAKVLANASKGRLREDGR